MKKLNIIFIAILSIVSCKDDAEETQKDMAITYPETKTVDTVTNYFGTEVKDPFRWLKIGSRHKTR